MAIAKRLRHFGGIGLHKAAIRLRQVHAEIMQPHTLACDDGIGFTKINLSVPGPVAQRHEHLAGTQPQRTNVIAQDRQATRIAMLSLQPLEYPLARMALLGRRPLVRTQYPARRYPGGSENCSIFVIVLR